MIELPALTPDGLRLVAVCVHFDAEDNVTLGDDVEVIAKVGEGPESEPIIGRKIIDTEGDIKARHFHVEVGLESAVGHQVETGTAEAMRSIPQSIVGMAPKATVWGQYNVAKARLPENGFVKILSGISMPHGDSLLTISGCTIDITGDDSFREIRWWGAGDDDVRVEISGYTEVMIDDQIFMRARQILDAGMERLVFRKKTNLGQSNAERQS